MREDGKVARHIEAGRRKEMLELVVEKMEGLRGLESAGAGRGEGKGRKREDGRRRAEGGKRKSWFS